MADVRIQGKGEPGVNGGPRGDLFVTVMISDPEFKRDGYNIMSDVLLISYPTAVLGGEVKVKTVDGEVVYGDKTGKRLQVRLYV